MIRKFLIIGISLVFIVSVRIYSQNIKAYYTNLGDNYEALDMDQDKIFGKYADLVVDLGTGKKVLFSRMTSYLPVLQIGDSSWKFNETIERNGDGDSERPDVLSRYSHVRLISSPPEHTTVHWRYFPDFANVEWDGVVDEYFTFFSSGIVSRKFKKGQKLIDDWNNENIVLETTYKLSSDKIDIISESDIKSSYLTNEELSSEQFEVKHSNEILLSISFDQKGVLKNNEVLEEVSNKSYELSGHKSLIKNGVSGKAIHFDGYYSGVKITSLDLSQLKQFTISSFIALGAYPFGVAPIVHQSLWNKKGFYLGVNENGFPFFNIGLNSEWSSIVSEEILELFKWYHIAATYNQISGEAAIYVNGQRKGSLRIQKGMLEIAKTDLMVGLNSQKMPNIKGRIRRGKWPSMYGIDGLLDEIKIYSRALDSDGVLETFESYKLTSSQINYPDMMKRELPVNPNNKKADKFGAQYTQLNYYETWDNLWRVSEHPDVVVTFDEIPANICFWRGTSYGPYFVTENGLWIGDQSNEDYRLIEHPGEAEGCLEHMSDKQCRHSHVRIIENTDARVVVHWRYGLVDSRYKFAPRNEGWGGWTDEYWTIYPDGVAIRDVARGIVFGDGWVETMFLSAPGTRPEDNVELKAITIMTVDDIKTLSWENDSPEGVFEDVTATLVNSKSKFKMFNVYPTGSSVEVFSGHSKLSKFHWWNHWPVSQITSDGRGAKAADRLAHSSLIWGAPSKHILMYGITNEPINNLIDLSNSWNFPSKIYTSDKKEVKYDQKQRAYIVQNLKKFELDVHAEINSPLLNPCFIIEDWKSDRYANLFINDEEIVGDKNLRQGFVYSTDGLRDLVLWVKTKITERTNIRIK